MPEYDSQHHWETTSRHGDEILALRESTGRLEPGQESFRASTQSGFADIQNILSSLRLDVKEAQKTTPLVQIVGVVISATVVFGGIVGFLFYNAMQSAETNLSAIQRESDLRFAQVSKEMAAGNQRLASDLDKMWLDKSDAGRRELKDAYAMGKRDQDILGLREMVMHLDEEEHKDDRAYAAWKAEIDSRLSSAETGMRASGVYMKEHTSQAGHINHPHALNPKPFDADMDGTD
mgnify:CR=1 FL=1